jgi:hypothetical protein
MVLATLAVQLHPERCAVQIAQCRPRARLRFVASASGEKPFDIIWADLGRLAAHEARIVEPGLCSYPQAGAVLKDTPLFVRSHKGCC